MSQDFHAWALDQAHRLRSGEPIDTERIAEKLESSGKCTLPFAGDTDLVNEMRAREADRNAWFLDQARRVRAGEPIDAEKIAEEFEECARNEEFVLRLPGTVRKIRQIGRRMRAGELKPIDAERRIAEELKGLKTPSPGRSHRHREDN